METLRPFIGGLILGFSFGVGLMAILYLARGEAPDGQKEFLEDWGSLCEGCPHAPEPEPPEQP